MNYYNYFTEIEETFVRRRGKNLVLSPLDWALMEIWREREVPLHIVLRAIESVFDIRDKQPQKRSVKSLAFCREEIEAQFGEWLETRVGAGPESSESDADDDPNSRQAIVAHLDESRQRLLEIIDSTEDAGLRETLGRVCDRLAELADERESSERLEQSLDILDDMIDRDLLASGAAAAHRLEVESMLAPNRGAMDTAAYERTFELMLRKKLRDGTGIPRLSLFYL
jgi:hypothetical protein